MKGKRNQHEWGYMGVSHGNADGKFKGAELSYCDLCKKYRVESRDGKGGYFIISRKEYLALKIPNSETGINVNYDYKPKKQLEEKKQNV